MLIMERNQCPICASSLVLLYVDSLSGLLRVISPLLCVVIYRCFSAFMLEWIGRDRLAREQALYSLHYPIGGMPTPDSNHGELPIDLQLREDVVVVVE